MEMKIECPHNYHERIYLFKAVLSPEEKARYELRPIAFDIPDIRGWFYHIREPYKVPRPDSPNRFHFRGQFFDGCWEGDVQINQPDEIPEISIDKVKEAFDKSINLALAKIALLSSFFE